MKLEWLETVMAVVKFGSFSEAAAVIPCSQSSVSRQVKNAEDELGVTIFKRSSNSNIVELTDDGETLLPLIEKLLKDYSELREHGRAIGKLTQMPLVLGLDSMVFSSSSKGILMSLLYLSHPEILLRMEEIAPSTRIEQLITGKLDAALLLRAFRVGYKHEPVITDDNSFCCIPLGAEHLSIAFGEAYAPEDRSGVTFRELRDKNFIFHTDINKNYSEHEEFNRHTMLVSACTENGFKPKILVVDRHLADIKQVMAVKGKGVYPSTIPAFLRDYPEICYVPVSDAPYYVQYYLLSLKNNKNPAIHSFAEFLSNNLVKSAQDSLHKYCL